MAIRRLLSSDEEVVQARRRFLVRALSLGFFGAGVTTLAGCAGGLARWGRRPELSPGRSIYRLSGGAAINGRSATEAGAELIFVVGKDAFIVRGASHVELEPRTPAMYAASGDSPVVDSVVSGLRVLSGSILSVFGERSAEERLSIDTITATIGNRGTGLYLEAESDRSYVCKCYGQTRITATEDPSRTRLVTSKYHNAPYYVLDAPENGQLIQPAPVINHTDAELTLIEALVDRVPPFQDRPDAGRY